jgi:predicted Zn-dependent protease
MKRLEGGWSVVWRILSRMAAATAVLSLLALPASAQQRISFVRDAEVESIIRAYAAPVFTVAGLDASAVGVHLVNDRSLNAFVAGGLNLFVNTGLLVRAENAGQVIGVIAHETGHISGGHLVRLREGMKNAMYESIVAMVIGAAVGAAAKDVGGGAAAGVLAGQQVGMRGILAYTRGMESSADQAAVNFLERAGLSARGLMEFLQIVADQELLATERQDPYVRSHPISRDRVEFVRNYLAQSRVANASLPPQFDEMHRRLRGKIQGFVDPTRALQVYKEDDRSIEARYGRAIAYTRRPDYPRAMAAIDDLLREKPNDGYFLELKAQTLMESGKVAESVPIYARSVELLPEEPLIRTAYAHAQMESGNPALLPEAIANLERSTQQDRDYGEAWRLLAVAYGRNDQIGMASLSQAELSVLRGKTVEARGFAERAQKLLPAGSPAWLRAQDISNANDPKKKDQ